MYACLNMKDLEFFIILEETEENWNKMAKQPPKTKQKKKKTKPLEKSTATSEFWFEAL